MKITNKSIGRHLDRVNHLSTHEGVVDAIRDRERSRSQNLRWRGSAGRREQTDRDLPNGVTRDVRVKASKPCTMCAKPMTRGRYKTERMPIG